MDPINPTLPTQGSSHDVWGGLNNAVHQVNINTINALVQTVNTLVAQVNTLSQQATDTVTAAFTKTVSGLAVTVNGSTSTAVGTTISGYAWTFGDSGTASGVSPAAHTYAAAGTYTITLTITAADGSIDTASQSVVVAASGFVLRQTKPDASTSSTGVIRTAPTTGNTTSNSLSNVSTSGSTYTGQHFTAAKVTVSAANVTFNDCLFDGVVVCASTGNNLTMSNCEVAVGANTSGVEQWLVNTSAATGAYLEFCKIHATAGNGTQDGVGQRNFHLYRCEIFNTTDGISAYPAAAGGATNVIVEGCYVHDLLQYAPDPLQSRAQTHNDCLQWQGGSNVQIVGCNFVANNGTGSGSTSYSPQINMSCVMVTPNVGNCTAGVIEDNWFDYGKIAVNGTAMSSGDSISSFKRNRFGANTKNGSTILPVGLDSAASNGYVTSGADVNFYSATGSQITYYFA